jgi:hypothetical protein
LFSFTYNGSFSILFEKNKESLEGILIIEIMYKVPVIELAFFLFLFISRVDKGNRAIVFKCLAHDDLGKHSI